MAFTPTFVTSSEGYNTSGTSVTGGTCGPTGNALVLAFAFAVRNGGDPGAISMSDSFGAGLGSWTQIGSQAVLPSYFGFVARMAVFYAVAAASPGTGTATASWSSSGASNGVWLEEVTTGYDTVTVIGGTNETTQSTGTTISTTLDSTPAASSIVMGYAIDIGGTTMTEGSGFSQSHVFTGAGGAETEYDTTPVDAVVDFSGLDNVRAGLVGFEILAAASGPTIPVFMHHYMQQASC